MISLDDLIAKVSSDEFLARLDAKMLTLGTDASKFRKGGALRVLMRAQAMTLEALQSLMIEAIRSGYLDLATGGWLTLLALYVFGVARREALAASGNLTFTNTGGGSFAPGDYPIGSVRIFSSRTKKKYLNAEPLSLGPHATVTIAVVAVEIGSASNASAGDIDSLETSLLGVTVSNAESVSGLEEESDDELRAACRARLAAISDLGPRGAYEWAVRQARRIDGSPTAINRVYVPEGAPSPIVYVTLAGPSGAPISGDVTSAENSIAAIARPSGIKVIVAPAVEVPFARTVTIWTKRTNGLDLAALATRAGQAIGAGFSTYPIGGIKKPSAMNGAVYTDFVKGLCKVHPAVFDIDLSNETDLSLSTGQVATWAGTVQMRVA